MVISTSSPKENPQATDDGRSESRDVPANAALQEADTTEISLAIDSLMMNNVGAARRAYIAKRVEENRIKVGEMTNNLHNLATERTASNGDNKDNLLTMRMKEAIAMQSRNIDISFGSSNSNNSQGDEHASVTLLVPGIEVKKSVRPILLPEVEKLPRYATWNFMDRNQTTRNPTNDKDDKKEFADTEDNIIRMVIENFGSSDTAFDVLAKRMSRKPCEVKARYEALVAKENPKPEEINHKDISSLLDEHLEEAQSSFNKLFCRKCLIFNCKVHGVGQEIVYPDTKLITWADMQEEDKGKVSCGPYCYLQVKKVTDFNCWRTLEKDLFEKGVEIFGKNSCLIARFFGGLKTCTEVFHVLEGYNPS